MSMEHDIECRYDVKAVAALKYGISQAVARLCLSHDRRKWPVTGLNIDTVLEWLKLPAGQKRWDAKRRLPADKDGLKRLGLLIDEEKILALRPDVSPANREAGLAPRPNKLDQRPDELDLRPEYWHNGPMP
jgi:hypothetical protein